MKKIAILGSTGSIGTQTLEVVEKFPENFQVTALTTGGNIDLLEKQIRKFQPSLAVVMEENKAKELTARVSHLSVEVLCGLEGLQTVATHNQVEMVVVAVVGSIGLLPTISAIERGKTIALANKETLVAAGAIVMRKAKEKGVMIIPIDSEHSAIFQSLQAGKQEELSKIILTASGGPFRNFSWQDLSHVTPEQALKHPNWSMGGKITIDSATLMNKGLEVIEAKWLFDVELDKIEVVVHPQSIIHSLVEFQDKSVIAQLGLPDMKVPIQYALTYPERFSNNLPSLELIKQKELTFEAPDLQRFPCLKYAYDALEAGGTMPTVLNAANEIAVYAFLKKQIGFLEIPRVIDLVMEKHQSTTSPNIEDILAADAWARSETNEVIQKSKKKVN